MRAYHSLVRDELVDEYDKGCSWTIVLQPLTVTSPATFLVSSWTHLTENAGINSALDNVIGPEGLLASKARIFVTNSISFVKQFDQLVYLRRGIVLESGSYDSIMNNASGEMYKLL